MSFPTFNEIIDALQARPEDVARRYAPGGRRDGQRYWALNPGRDDSKIGSFYVCVAGKYVGRFRDEVTKEMGDMLDLIQLALHVDRPEALEEAKRFLGMSHETPHQRELRLRQETKTRVRQEQDAAADRERVVKRHRDAQGIFLASQPDIADTPVEWYLANRAITLRDLGRAPGAIRFHPGLRYYYVDKNTGEVFEGEYPAMVAAIYEGWTKDQRPAFIGVHRTYLAQRQGGGGIWGKAPLPKAKLVFGSKKGGYIRLWTGKGARGGKGAPLSRAPAGSTLYITEGIEDGLSVAVLDPSRRVAAASDLGNISEMRLPPNISNVVIVADNDPKPEQTALIDKAVRRFRDEGRGVKVWRNTSGGKDINDALVAAKEVEGAA